MKKKNLFMMVMLLVVAVAFTGCSSFGLRYEPDQEQKQNAYLHYRTNQAIESELRKAQLPQTLQELATQSVAQSSAILNYYGMPDELPEADTPKEILSPANKEMTKSAANTALERPDPWETADSFIQLAIGVAGVFGGVAGGRVIKGLKKAKQTSQALREVVRNNNRLKIENPDAYAKMKNAQQGQTAQTKNLVASICNEDAA